MLLFNDNRLQIRGETLSDGHKVIGICLNCSFLVSDVNGSYTASLNLTEYLRSINAKGFTAAKMLMSSILPSNVTIKPRQGDFLITENLEQFKCPYGYTIQDNFQLFRKLDLFFFGRPVASGDRPYRIHLLFDRVTPFAMDMLPATPIG